MKTKRLTILISAYACEPDKGSEPGVGWKWVQQIARFHEAWVITRLNNRKSLERELKNIPDANVHFIYYDLPRWLCFWKKGEKRVHLYYVLWQLGVYGIAKRVIGREHIDLIHHITYGSVFLPTFLSYLPVPFVWGSIGGGEKVSKVFRSYFGIRARIKEFLRDLIIDTLRFNLFFLWSCRKAEVIFCKTEDTAKRVPDRFKSKIVVTTDVGVELGQAIITGAEEPVILAVGRLDAWRGFDLAIEAFRYVHKDLNGLKLVIIGDGPDKGRLHKICATAMLEERVKLAGKLDRGEYLEYLSKSAMVINPCLKEGGATVLFEALSYEKPIICLDIPGTSRIVTDECGIKIKPINRTQTIRDLGDAMRRLAADSTLRKTMGSAGRKMVASTYSWNGKGTLLKDYYQRIMAR